MLLTNSFKKDIFRTIDPVVKANSTDHLANELEEFVITGELEGHLARFFDEYNAFDAAGNGAWISGFFGSGKSHLLKILAVVLEDRQVGGQGAVDYILPKLDDNPMLASALQAARAKHPSESILFNIDSIAPNQSRAKTGPLLAAFIRAFNMHRGYFDGDAEYIARLEYDLDRDGKLEAFKSAIERDCKKPWEVVRKGALIHTAKISAVFDEVCGNEPGTSTNILHDYQETYKPSVRSFAEMVKEYIDAKGPGFRLNFFVDEVGQFIAQNTDLMVNLQSVAEELNTVCEGASWVVVTSQENMEDIVGQMESRSANDFSKIQARFKVKMTLTSQDAKEVIRTRLLAKNDEASFDVYQMYQKYSNDFRVLFDFTDGVNGARTFGVYQDAEEFERTYPFVPYQFDLFMEAMRRLSSHNAFTGRHNSTGARSMLGVFQGVVQHLCQQGASVEDETLATFDLMFEGLRNDLKSEVYAAISQAEDNLGRNSMEVRVLKVLLLVKYYTPEFVATPANLRVLLYGGFKQNTAEVEREIKAALENLERQVYVRRNGGAYEYMTDEEKDIENEINSTELAESDKRALIAELFGDACGARKVTYKNGAFEHSYAYNLKVDGESAGGQQRNDLTLDLVTVFEEDWAGVSVVSSPKTLSVAVKDSKEFLLAVARFCRTSKYISLKRGVDSVREAILSDKEKANYELRKSLKVMFADLLTNASYFCEGVDITPKVSGSGKDAVANGMLELVKRTYTSLQQLTVKFDNDLVFSQCTNKQMVGMLPEYCQTVLNFINNVPVSMLFVEGENQATSLTGIFAKGNHGWPDVAVRSALAQLYAVGHIELRLSNGELLEGADLADALRRRKNLDRLQIRKIESVDPAVLAELQKAYRGFAGTNPQEQDVKAIAKELVGYVAGVCDVMEGIMPDVMRYPFAEEFKACYEALKRVQGNARSDWRWVKAEFIAESEGLTQKKESLEKMAEFVQGSGMQKKWEEIREILRNEAEYLALGADRSVLNEIRAAVESPQCYVGSNVAHAGKKAVRLKADAEKAKENLKKEVAQKLFGYKASFESAERLREDVDAKAKFDALFEAAGRDLEALTSVLQINGFVEDFKSRNSSVIAGLVLPVRKPVQKSAPQPAVAQEGGGAASAPVAEPAPQPAEPETVSFSVVSGNVQGSGILHSEEDVEAFIAALREELLTEIAHGRVIMR